MKRQTITRAMDHLDDELIADALENKTTTKQRSGGNFMKTWQKWAAAAAAFVFMLTAVLLAVNFNGGASGAVIAFDVNPSLEIVVDKNEKVVKVNALNEDAQVVIGEMDLVGSELDVAVNAIIGSMLVNNYLSIDQNSILVSVDSESGKTAEQLQKSISDTISALLKNKDISASVLTQDYVSGEASGKDALIEKILAAKLTNASGELYTREQLSALNINELKLMLESKGVTLEGVGSSGEASEGKYIGHDAALDAALTRAGLKESEVERVKIELDYEDDYRKMVYEVEFVNGGYEYEYEIAADKDGGAAILKEDREIAELFDDDDYVTAPAGAISAEEAIAKALAHAKVAEADAIDIDCELEKGWFGKYTYEIDFEAGGNEYEYRINALTGEVLRSKVERDD